MSICMRPSIRSLRALCLAGFLGAVLYPGLGYSDNADAAPETVAVDVQKDQPDLDRDLMGEFTGPVALAPNRYQPTALQIRPIGDGGFEAIQYTGGLPGDRTFRGEPVTLLGKRAGDFLVLSGAPWAIFVEKNVCVIVDRKGTELGRLQRVVRQSPTLGASPPKDAMVLFDGSGTEQFTVAEMTEEGLLTEGADIKQMFQDFNLHLEFYLPYMPAMRGQARGNSGVYVQSRYEVQILDSFATEPVIDGCGALYKFRAPDLNMCFPPLQWQTYDIAFTSPRWASDGTKVRNARVTVWLNGVKVQDDVELAQSTGLGKLEEPVLLPIRLQDHKCPVRYRNIWIVDRGLTNVGQFPIHGKPVPQSKEPVPNATEKQSKAKKEKDLDKEKPAADKVDAPVDAKQTEPKAKPASETPAAAPQEESAVKPEKKEPQKPAEPDTKQSSPAKEETEEVKAGADDSKPAEPQPKSDPPKKDESAEQKKA